MEGRQNHLLNFSTGQKELPQEVESLIRSMLSSEWDVQKVAGNIVLRLLEKSMPELQVCKSSAYNGI